MPRPVLPPYRARPANAPLALEGLRVVDFTQMLAGPFCTQELADLGAEVIKIESPGRGDDSRHYTTTSLAGECAFFLSTNRNKKSVVLDLKNDGGREIALKLIAQADIVVENFSNGVMERLGLDYTTLSEKRPELIYCSISSYGRDDVAAISRRGYDAMFQAASGFMSLTGEPDRAQMRTTVPIIDTATALTATSAILAAVVARHRIGRGQFVEVALLDVAMACLTMYGMAYLVSGNEMQRNGNRAPQTAPSDVYQTATGPVFLTCGNDRLFRRMCIDGFGRSDLADDPRFASNPERVRNVTALSGELAGIFDGNTQAHWVKTLSEVGVPIAPVATIPEAMASQDVAARNILSEVFHPTAGAVPNVRAPYLFSHTPCADPVAPPLLGQHTHSVLEEVLAMTPEEISRFSACGALGPKSETGEPPRVLHPADRLTGGKR